MFCRFSTFRRVMVPGFLLAAMSVASIVHAVAQDADGLKRGRKYKAPPPTSHVEVTVVRATTGKPIEDAAVIFHPMVDGHDNGNMELKTNEDGKATIDLLVTGSNVRLQIIAPGYQTYGEDYKIDKDNLAIEVKLKRPAEQYSIYKKSEGAGAAADKPADAPKDAAPEAPKDGSAKDATADAAKNSAKDSTKDSAKDSAKDSTSDSARPQDATAPPK